MQVYGWTLFSIAVQAVPAAIFTLVGAGQMMQWALQKHARLRKVSAASALPPGG
jgi:very-long-chain enoyl-CoA reductase